MIVHEVISLRVEYPRQPSGKRNMVGLQRTMKDVCSMLHGHRGQAPDTVPFAYEVHLALRPRNAAQHREKPHLNSAPLQVRYEVENPRYAGHESLLLRSNRSYCLSKRIQTALGIRMNVNFRANNTTMSSPWISRWLRLTREENVAITIAVHGPKICAGFKRLPAFL